jgi:tRNA nucleotidyltransferase (CCA-adding enzyme)
MPQDGLEIMALDAVRFRMPQAVGLILHRLGKEADAPSWLVGGCVRDAILNRQIKDWDITTPLTPDKVVALFQHVVPTGIDYGTVTVLDGGLPVEVTTMRSDGQYSDGRRPDAVTFTTDLLADLARRDFRMNAVAVDPINGEVCDPYGGVSDIAVGSIQAVGQPLDRFREDGLRPLRAVRFAAQLSFRIADLTADALRKSGPYLAQVAPERMRDELNKILLSGYPWRGIMDLHRYDLLCVVLPEMVPMVGCLQNRHHEYDVWEHSVYALRCLATEDQEKNLALRLAVLLHDVGKPASKSHVEDGPHKGEASFIGHEKVGAEIAASVMDRLRYPTEDREMVVALVANHMWNESQTKTDAGLRRLIRRIGAERFTDQLVLRLADTLAKGERAVDPRARLDAIRSRAEEIMARKDPLSVKMLAINGRDVMEALGIAEGPAVGRVLRNLLAIVMESPEENTREGLLTWTRNYGKEFAGREPAVSDDMEAADVRD